MLHIAIDASRATRATRTGTENYARQLIQRLVAAHPEVRWTLFFRDDPGAWLAEHPHVERVVLPAPRLWTYTALAPALLSLKPDLFWEPAHVLPPTVPLAGIPSLVTVHDLGYEHFPAAHTTAQRTYLRLTTRYHAAATRIVADSEATRDDLLRFYQADPAKIAVVPLGVDLAAFQPITDAAELARVQTKYHTGKHFLLYVGTIQPRKNLERLVRAFAEVVERHPDVNLVLAGGKGWLEDDLQRTIDALGVRDCVIRPGYVDDVDLPALLSAAEVFVFPSLFEGFGLPVLEAMACGTPVLTSTTSSLPEVAGDAALLVDPTSDSQIRDGLLLLLGQPPLRQELRERGLRRVHDFTWEQSADAIWQEIETVLGAVFPRSTFHTHSGTGVSKSGTWNVERGTGNKSIKAISILGLPIHSLTWAETMAQIEGIVESGQVHQIATANPEFLMRARREPAFMDVLKAADLVVPDGSGLLLAARLYGKRFADKITGSDLTPMLARIAAEKGWKLYLLGAAPGVAQQAADALAKLHPTLQIIADGSDPAPDGPPNLIARIRTARPHILLVAYGAPKQDYWIAQWGRQTGVPVQIGIGGALDFIAGVIPRAPKQWQDLHVEWLWRLRQEPWRWRRMLALPQFVLAAAREAMGQRWFGE